VAGQALWRGLASYHLDNRKRRRRLVPFFIANYARYAMYKLGRMSRDEFVAAWGERLAGLFAGVTVSEGREVYAWVWEHYLEPALRRDVVARLNEHLAQGHTVVLVSATLDGLVAVVAERLGAYKGAGSVLEVRGQCYTGRIVPPLCFGPHKATRARAEARAAGIDDLSQSFAYADSAYDAPFLESVGHPTAVYPDTELAALAAQRGWPLLGTPQEGVG
jgi:HAD superfamily hydrolase (TIGR01490 family)